MNRSLAAALARPAGFALRGPASPPGAGRSTARADARSTARAARLEAAEAALGWSPRNGTNAQTRWGHVHRARHAIEVAR